MNCPKCGVENRHDASFCGECGASLAQEIVCSNCKRSNPAGRNFCDGCGQRLRVPSAASAREPGSYTPKHLAEKILTSRSALEGERKTITALFADIKGSMELLGIQADRSDRLVGVSLEDGPVTVFLWEEEGPPNHPVAGDK